MQELNLFDPTERSAVPHGGDHRLLRGLSACSRGPPRAGGGQPALSEVPFAYRQVHIFHSSSKREFMYRFIKGQRGRNGTEQVQRAPCRLHELYPLGIPPRLSPMNEFTTYYCLHSQCPEAEYCMLNHVGHLSPRLLSRISKHPNCLLPIDNTGVSQRHGYFY